MEQTVKDAQIARSRYRVLLRRNADAVERWSKWYDPDEPGMIVFSWREHNFSCDCNRHLEFERAGGTPEDECWAGTEPCGEDERYSVLGIENEAGQALDEWRMEWRHP